MPKLNFRGEPIHEAPFLAKVETARRLLVGKRVCIETSGRVPVWRDGDRIFEQKSAELLADVCVEIALVPDYDSINLVLKGGFRYGMLLESISADRIAGPTGGLAMSHEWREVRLASRKAKAGATG